MQWSRTFQSRRIENDDDFFSIIGSTIETALTCLRISPLHHSAAVFYFSTSRIYTTAYSPFALSQQDTIQHTIGACSDKESLVLFGIHSLVHSVGDGLISRYKFQMSIIQLFCSIIWRKITCFVINQTRRYTRNSVRYIARCPLRPQWLCWPAAFGAREYALKTTIVQKCRPILFAYFIRPGFASLEVLPKLFVG
jgi:hypothetical protein